MAKNKVPFHKSISIHGFISQLDTEEQCRKRLFDMRWPAGYHCVNCGHDKYCELKLRQIFQCNQCQSQWLINFRNIAFTVKVITKHLIISYLSHRAREEWHFSIRAFSTAGYSYNAVWRMKHKRM